MGRARLYDIKDAGHYLGVAPSTLRYWESEGLVHAGRDTANDYRRYSLHDLIEASEIAFYRKLGVPVRELKEFRALSARSLDEALIRTEERIAQHIAELEATQARLSWQRALNAQAEQIRRVGMRPSAPAFASLSAIDYDAATPWKLLVEKPWRYGVLIYASTPKEVHESIVSEQVCERDALWVRSDADNPTTCRECLLKVEPDTGDNNAALLCAEATQQGIVAQAVVGSYLLTASDETGRWDLYRAWVVGKRAT